MEYRREIDGLRAVAVIPVILFHAGVDSFSGGFVGVDIFFVISGYLITSIILAEKEKKTFSIINFYDRRARRILPALFFTMIVCVPFAWFLLMPRELMDFSESLISVSFFSSNIYFYSESGYFDTANDLKPLLHTWSLAVEEQFYVLFPLFLMFVWRMRKRWILSSIIIIGCISLLLAQWGASQFPSATLYLLPTRAWELMVGASVAFYMLYHKNHSLFIINHRVLSEGFGVIGLLLISHSIVLFNKDIPFPSIYALVPTVGTALIILYASKITFVGQVLATQLFVGVGVVSYSAYLWHQPLFAFYRYQSSNELNHFALWLLIGITFALAYFSWRYIEKPFRNRSIVNRKFIFQFSILGTLLFISIGFLGYDIKGYSPFMNSNIEKRAELIKLNHEIRQKEIGAGKCHFNKRGLYIDINTFLENWSCVPNDESSLLQTTIGVFGDSHSADKAIALKQNGYDVAQLGGAGCPLEPSAVTADKSYCSLILERFTSIKGIDTVLLAYRFTVDELTKKHIKNILAYWATRYKKVLLFSPMPEFTNAHRNYIRSGIFSNEPSVDFSQRFYDVINQLELPSNLVIINTKFLFCGSKITCEGMLNGKLLLTDYGHLTIFGAQIFGKRLIETADFEAVILHQ